MNPLSPLNGPTAPHHPSPATAPRGPTAFPQDTLSRAPATRPQPTPGPAPTAPAELTPMVGAPEQVQEQLGIEWASLPYLVNLGRPATLIGMLRTCLACQDRAQQQAAGGGAHAEAMALLAHGLKSSQRLLDVLLDLQTHEVCNPHMWSALRTRLQMHLQAMMIAWCQIPLPAAEKTALLNWQDVVSSREMTLGEIALVVELARSHGLSIQSGKKFLDTLKRARAESQTGNQSELQREEIMLGLWPIRDKVCADPLLTGLFDHMKQHEMERRRERHRLIEALVDNPDTSMTLGWMGEVFTEMTSTLALSRRRQRPAELAADLAKVQAVMDQISVELPQAQAGLAREQQSLRALLCRSRVKGRLATIHMQRRAVPGKQSETDDLKAAFEGRLDTLMADTRTEVTGRAQNFARAVHEGVALVDLARLMRASELPDPCILPASLVTEGEALLQKLQGAPDIATAVRGKIADLVQFARCIDTDARADGLLWRQAQHLDAHMNTLAFIKEGLRDLAPRVKALLQRGGPVPTPPAAAGLDAMAEGKLQKAYQCLKETLQPPATQEEEAAGGTWQQVQKQPKLAPRYDRPLAEQAFHRGTFASAWDSALYHFAKHTQHLPNATMRGYIERAQAARAEWTGLQDANLGNPTEKVRVVNSSTTWLVFADHPEGRIVSYHDRTCRPYPPRTAV